MANPAADPGREEDGPPEGDPNDDWFDGDTLLNLFGAVVVLGVIAAVVFVGLLVAGGGPGESIAPAADWTLTRINDSHVRIVHAGGEPVDAGSLVVTADGRERHPDWSADPLAEGDGGTFRATRARSVVRLWIEVGAERELLESWDVS